MRQIKRAPQATVWRSAHGLDVQKSLPSCQRVILLAASNESEFYFRQKAARHLSLEQGHREKSKERCNHTRRKDRDLGVEGHNTVVVRLSREGDSILGRGQLFLQTQHIRTRLEIGIVLNGNSQAHQELIECTACTSNSTNGDGVSWACAKSTQSSDSRIARDDHRFERLTFVRHVSLDGFNKIWDQFASAFELHIDLAQAVARANASSGESVVGAHDPQSQNKQHHNENGNEVIHAQRIGRHYSCVEVTEQQATSTIPAAVEQSLARLGFATPTEIQVAMHTPILEGKDVLALAPTGSGKTLGFGIPMIVNLLRNAPRAKRGTGGSKYVEPCERLRAIVISPTRELAQQVASDIASVAKGGVLRIASVYGKSPSAPQRAEIRAGLDLLVGTPGRLREFLDDGTLTFANVRTVVIDEADRMADMGFLPQIEQLLSTIPSPRQVICMSATLPATIEARVRSLLRDPVMAEVGSRNAPASRANKHYQVADDDKVALLLALLRDGHRRGVAVYVRTRRRAGWVAQALRRNEITVSLLHGDRSQRSRNEALAAFAEGDCDVLVATDVAARGLHVPRIKTVINYDVPLMPEDFVHRIGRAGHGGGMAESFTFVDALEERAWARVNELVGTAIQPAAAIDFEKFKRRVEPSLEERTAAQLAWRPSGIGAPRSAPTATPFVKGAGRTSKKTTTKKLSPKARAKATSEKKLMLALERGKTKKLFSVSGKLLTTREIRKKRERSAPLKRENRPGGGIRRSGPSA